MCQPGIPVAASRECNRIGASPGSAGDSFAKRRASGGLLDLRRKPLRELHLSSQCCRQEPWALPSTDPPEGLRNGSRCMGEYPDALLLSVQFLTLLCCSFVHLGQTEGPGSQPCVLL